MANPVRFPDAVRFDGAATFSAGISGIGASGLDTVANSEFAIPMTAWRVWDNMSSLLPGTATGDDLELNDGTFGTSSPAIQTGDIKTTSSTRYARCQVQLPYSYEAGTNVVLRFRSQMVTTVADGSCTLDAQAYRSDEAAGIGSDLVTTAATTINTLTDADVNFTTTGASLNPGDTLDVRIAIAYVDTATGTAVIGEVGAGWLVCTTRG